VAAIVRQLSFGDATQVFDQDRQLILHVDCDPDVRYLLNAIVTGAGRGLGAATAKALAARGYTVTLIARSDAEIGGVAETIGEGAFAVAADVANPSDIQRAIRASIGRFGPPDVFFGNAAVLGPIAPIDAVEPGEWLQPLLVNVYGAFLCLHEIIPHMPPGAQVVGVSSGAALSIIRYHSAYNSSKAAFEHLYRHAAAEHPELRIAILDPGGMQTSMMGEVLSSEFPDAEQFREMARPRLRRPEGVAHAVVDLLGRGVESGKRYHVDELIAPATA
jgi:NAD(P)-dependent dehydrogenase (short-subunit alcohol dehydrogenase family)